MLVKYFIGFIVLLQLCKLSLGHLCLLDPPQRQSNFTSETVLLPGDNRCYLVKSNCGGIQAGEPVAQYDAGSTINVYFQQNYNHWYTPMPGFLDVSISYTGDNGSFQILSKNITDYNPWDMVTTTDYIVPITLPTQTCKDCVLRVRYISNNAGEPYPDFYQCSDISIQ